MTQKTSIEEINIDFIKVHPLVKDFNNPKKKDHIEYTMKRYGQFIPLIGNQVDDTFYIINGIVRFEIAKSLGLKSLMTINSNIADEDVLSVRLQCNQQTKMSYSEMAQYGENMLGLIGKSQGKKRDLMGCDFINKDDHYGLVGKERFDLVCHLLNLPVKASSLRKLMEIKWFEDENPDNSIGLISGLDDGLYKVDAAYKMMKSYNDKVKDNEDRVRRDYEGKTNDVSYKVFNTTSLDLSDIEDLSMRMFIQSPPYWKLRKYDNQDNVDFIHGQEETLQEYLDNEIRFYEGAKNKLLPNGVLVIIVGETYLGGYQGVCTKLELALEQNGWEILDVNIFHKTNQKSTPHKERFLNSYERIIVAKQKGSEEALFNDVKRPSSVGQFKVIPGSSRSTGGKGHSMASPLSSITNMFSSSVFQKKEYEGIDDEFHHLAPTSKNIYSDFIAAYSNPGENVGDMFSGSGSGLEAALFLGRNAFGWEVDYKSVEFSHKRLEEKLQKALDERNQIKEELLCAA